MSGNSESRTADGWGEREEEWAAFGLSTLATAYGIAAGALRARISSSTTTTFGEKFSKFKRAGGEIDLAEIAEIELPQAAGAGAGAGDGPLALVEVDDDSAGAGAGAGDGALALEVDDDSAGGRAESHPSSAPSRCL